MNKICSTFSNLKDSGSELVNLDLLYEFKSACNEKDFIRCAIFQLSHLNSINSEAHYA